MARLPVQIGIGSVRAQTEFDIRSQFAVIEKNFKSFLTEVEDLSVDATIEALEPTFQLSQVYVPVKTGKLKASGYLRKVGIGKNARAAIGYGLHNSPHYALIVHERTDIPHRDPTQAKFLERAIDEDSQNILPRVAHIMQRKMRTRNGSKSGKGKGSST